MSKATALLRNSWLAVNNFRTEVNPEVAAKSVSDLVEDLFKIQKFLKSHGFSDLKIETSTRFNRAGYAGGGSMGFSEHEKAEDAIHVLGSMPPNQPNSLVGLPAITLPIQRSDFMMNYRIVFAPKHINIDGENFRYGDNKGIKNKLSELHEMLKPRLSSRPMQELL